MVHVVVAGRNAAGLRLIHAPSAAAHGNIRLDD
jgi:hypothetical protein